MKMLSICQIIVESVYQDDFWKRFSGLDGVVAFDLNKRLSGWKLGITESMAVKDAEMWELLDGLVVY